MATEPKTAAESSASPSRSSSEDCARSASPRDCARRENQLGSVGAALVVGSMVARAARGSRRRGISPNDSRTAGQGRQDHGSTARSRAGARTHGCDDRTHRRGSRVTGDVKQEGYGSPMNLTRRGHERSPLRPRFGRPCSRHAYASWTLEGSLPVTSPAYSESRVTSGLGSWATATMIFHPSPHPLTMYVNPNRPISDRNAS